MRSLRTLSLLLTVLAVGVTVPSPALTLADNEAPTLREFSFAPDEIDVTAGSQPVTVMMRVTDDETGVGGAGSSIMVLFVSPSGSQSRRVSGFSPFGDFSQTGGGPLDGTWQGTVEFPQFSEEGPWTVEDVQIRDVIGNNAKYDADDLVALGFPTQLDVTSVSDTTPPTLVGLSFDPTSIDASTGPDTVLVTLQVTDDVTGVGGPGSSIMVAFVSPSGSQVRRVSGFSATGFTLIGGGPLDGTWQGPVEFPQFSEAGTWTIQDVQIRDVIGNNRRYELDDLRGLPVPTDLEVTSIPSDDDAPQLVEFSFLPIFIDTSTGAGQVVVTMRVTDDLTGVGATGSSLMVLFRSPSGSQSRRVSGLPPFGDFSQIGGGPLDGTWQGTAQFPQSSDEGTWSVVDVQIRDAIGNNRKYKVDDLQAGGFLTSLDVVRSSLESDGEVTYAAGTDTATVEDEGFGSSATLTIPRNVLNQSEPTDVAIDVFDDPPPDPPIPTGFSAEGSYFMNISLTPEPAFPLAAPGMTVVLPLAETTAPGTSLTLFRVDPATGYLIPALDTSTPVRLPVIGTVLGPGGWTAEFTNVSELSTVVALLPGDLLTTQIDIKPGGTPNSINPKSKGKIPVAILSTPDFDAPTYVVVPSLRFGASGTESSLSHCNSAGADVNGDGLVDLVCHFYTQVSGFQIDDVEGILTGDTALGVPMRGSDSVRIVGKKEK